MLYIYIALGIIVVSLAIIITIYARKFARAKTMNVGTISEEKQAIVRDRILLERLRRHGESGKEIMRKVSSPVSGRVKGFFEKLYDKLLSLEKKYQRESLRRPQVSDAAFEEKMNGVLLEADDLLKRELFAEAEKKYIEVISFDAGNKKAYRGLVDLYLAKKEEGQAIQTMNYIIKLDLAKAKPLDKKDDFGKKYRTYDNAAELTEDYLRLGELYSNINEAKKSLASFKKAFALNPNDPKTLDLLINASIILGDKVAALNYFNRLAKSNPDNQKLLEYRKKMDEMG